MRINIIAVGKLSASYYKEAFEDYSKRYSRFGRVCVTEIAEEPLCGDNPKDEQHVIEKEGDAIIKKLQGYVIVLAIKGSLVSSEDLACLLSQKEVEGVSTVTFVIGGSLGLSLKVLSLADKQISFGKITYPHQLIRVVLMEQVYRAAMINNNCKYHK